MRARDLGVISCDTCELVMRSAIGEDVLTATCARCGEPVRRRKPNGTKRAWAYLLSAAALYVPANILVVMRTTQFPNHREDTIWSGVVFLWHRGSWDLSLLVLTASIVVPAVKLVALAVLLLGARRGSAWRPRARTKLYRVLEVVGHWSMLDVFVVSLLTAMVHVGRFASVEPGPAVLPFAAVVILTMLASASFDPRAIWDGYEAVRRG